MAEAAVEGLEREENDNAKRVRPPDRKKHEEELEALNAEIKAKDSLMKQLNPRGDEGTQGQLREIRGEKEGMIQRYRDLDAELKHVNIEIVKRKESLARIETGLQYKNEDKINEAIRRLEHQLKTTNYGLREEKRIVAEIDRLKRSKKSLVQYNSEKKDLDIIWDGQRRKREQRDQFFKASKTLKTREEHLRRSLRENREKAEVVKKELDELHGKRRALQSEFKKQDREYNEHRNEKWRRKQEEYRLRKEEERMLQQEQYHKDLAEYEASREPYEDEKQLCRTLAAYLQRYLVDEAGDKNLSMLSPEEDTTDQVDVAEPEGMKILKKKDDLDLFGGVKPKVNKKKKEKKKAVNKVVHTPEVLSQFLQIGLKAPSSVNDVPESIKQLKDRLEYYHSLPPPPKIDLLDGAKNAGDLTIGAEGSSGGSGAPSLGESAICESVLSTPEVQNDNTPPHFNPKGPMDELWPQPRRISRDSGTELEETDELSSNEVSHMTSNNDLLNRVGHAADLDNNNPVAVVDSMSNTGVLKDSKAFNFAAAAMSHLVDTNNPTNQNIAGVAPEQLQVSISDKASCFVDNTQEGSSSDLCTNMEQRHLESKGAGLLNHNVDIVVNERIGEGLQEVIQPIS